MTEFFARLKQRKLVQWALAYIAASFALIQVIDVVADSYDWPRIAPATKDPLTLLVIVSNIWR